MSITPLTTGDTFQTWFNTTNSIISEVNGITVHNILPGDGISLTSSGNVFTIKHGSSVGTPVTFTGPVSFTNTVSFSSSVSVNTVTVAVSPIISGITIGNVVRITDTGLTLSRANSAENAEVLGVVVGSDASSHTVATSGIVNNTTFPNTISNLLGVAGGTLSIGCAYFLRSDVAGGITTIEPNTYGHVSKPILLGVTGSAGAILPYRGIQIEGISAGITAELDNKIIIRVDYTTNNGQAPVPGYFSPLNKGDVVSYPGGNSTFGVMSLVNLANGPDLKLLGRIDGETSYQAFPTILVCRPQADTSLAAASGLHLGVVSAILEDDGSVLTIEVTTRGGSFLVKKSELDPLTYSFDGQVGTVLSGGVFKLDLTLAKYAPVLLDSFERATNFAQLIPHGDPEETITFIYNGTEYLTTDADGNPTISFLGTPVSGSQGVTGGLEYDNLVPNGSFTIWQRGFAPLSGVTAAGLSAFHTPIADRWFYIKDSINLSGLTAWVERGEFSTTETTVPGSPRYWVDLKQQYTSSTGLNYRPRFENIQSGARLLQGQQATITFWAHAGVCGATVDVVYNRYGEPSDYSIASDVSDAFAGRIPIATGVELGLTWQKYAYTFNTTAQPTGIGVLDEGWYGIGFEFPSSGVTLSVAQVKLELGSDAADYVYTPPEKELHQCLPYYLRTYDWDQPTGFTGTSRLNEEYLTLGNLLSQSIYDIKFPVEMVRSPDVILYSPTGEPNEAYNVTKRADMRFPRCEGCPIHVNLPWDTSTVRTSLPSGNITVSNTSKNGMQLTINNGATHLDTLKFHYVADADIDLNSI